MQRLRLILTWLIFLALPLQGLAAASMQVCATGQGDVAHHTMADHSHSGPAGHGAHAGHAGDAGHAASVDGAGSVPKAGSHHGCTVCAFCVHGLATCAGGAARLARAAPEPLPGWVQMRIDSPTLPLPDKPPRA